MNQDIFKEQYQRIKTQFLQSIIIKNNYIFSNGNIVLPLRRANAQFVRCFIDKYIPVIIYVAKHHIKEGEEIIVDYEDPRYWEEKYNSLLHEKEMQQFEEVIIYIYM